MKKLKGICLALLTVILSVAMLMGTFTLVAFADTKNITVSEGTTAAKFVKRIKYGEPTKAFKGATKLVTPNGSSVDGAALDEYTPLQVGVYTVYYGENYSYSVNCYLDAEYELRVENNGADIATYTEVGKKLIVPKASVWKKTEEDDEFVEDKDTEVFVSISNTDYTDKPAKTAGEYELTKPSTYTVHYEARVKDGTKYLYKDYTAKVQQQGSINDQTIPTLTVVNVPTTLSLNNKVTLPKATATDNYDENVKVEITVQVYDAANNAYRNVRTVKTDPKTGYAIEENADNETHSNDVVFDNEYNLSFYPTVNGGTYKITYQAFDDNDNKTAISTHTYTATCSDRSSPLLQEIDDFDIPTTWGLEVNRAATIGEIAANANEKTKAVDKAIVFPYPTYDDNNGKENLTVSFEIKDTTNNKTVLRFANIYDTSAEGKGCKYTYNKDSASDGIYNPDIDAAEGTPATTLTFGENGFTGFDFKTYEKSLKAVDKNASAAGSYTVSYQARDNVPNIVTKTYNITLESTFTDSSAPTVEKPNWQESYLVFTASEEEFTIPTANISDNSDGSLEISYKLFDGNSEENFIEVKGGETAKLQLKTAYNKEEGTFAESGALNPTLTVKGEKGEADKVLQFTNSSLEYAIVAIDDVGNKTIRANGERAKNENNKVDAYTDAKADDTEIAIVNADTLATTTPTVTFTATGNANEVGQKVNIGSYTVENLSSDVRKYFGFEISLYTTDKEGNTTAWTSGQVELYTYYKSSSSTLYVDDITVAMPNAKSVTMYFRVYDVAGRSFTDEQTFTIASKDPDNGNVGESSLNIGTAGSVQTSYILKNTKVNLPTGAEKHIIRKIRGNGKFSLTGGALFTAYNAGTFTFTEYYEMTGNSGNKDGYKLADKAGSYDWTASEKSTPVWQIQGKMPTYTELKDEETSGVVTLPHVVASTEYANAKIDLSVSFAQAGGSTKSLTVAKDETETDKDVKIVTQADIDKANSEFKQEDLNKYYFTATQDGTYTMTYRATYGDNEPIEQTFTMKAGDIVAPTFKVATPPKATATENSRFKFSPITLESSEDVAEIGNVRFTKTLEGPDGTTVFTVDGTGSTYRDKLVQSGSDYENGYKFTKTGVYTVRYTVTDKAGNASMTTYTITVSAAKVNNPVSTKIISTILIIVGVLLIAGVILYFVRFRKVKTDKVKK